MGQLEPPPSKYIETIRCISENGKNSVGCLFATVVCTLIVCVSMWIGVNVAIFHICEYLKQLH